MPSAPNPFYTRAVWNCLLRNQRTILYMCLYNTFGQDGERPPQASFLCQALCCAGTGSSRQSGSALGGSFRRSSSGREASHSGSVWGRPWPQTGPWGNQARWLNRKKAVAAQSSASDCRVIGLPTWINCSEHLIEV